MKTPRLDRQIELMNMHKALDELTIEGEQSLKEYTDCILSYGFLKHIIILASGIIRLILAGTLW